MKPALRIVIVAPETLAVDDPTDENTALPADTFLQERLAQIAQDMVIVDAESGARDTLEHVVVATRDARRPIVLFPNDEDTSHVGGAIAACVTAYVASDLVAGRVKPVLEIAFTRFEHEESLRSELTDASTQLSDRKTIDRAKGILMKRQSLPESEA